MPQSSAIPQKFDNLTDPPIKTRWSAARAPSKIRAPERGLIFYEVCPSGA
jgi:hypothetical protein